MSEPDPTRFPNAPADWTPEDALRVASKEALKLTDEHWDAVRALQEYYARHADVPMLNKRDLHDALDEKFHAKGGLRHLYEIFPGGPIAQGCRLAGLKPPEGAIDKAFGSVS